MFLHRAGVDIVYHIYVCDIDKPWAVHQLISIGEQVVGLEWHNNGFQLLIATLGSIFVYQMKVNNMTCNGLTAYDN